MQLSLRNPAVVLSVSLVFSCGVLEPAPDSQQESSPAPLTIPVVPQLTTANGTLVTSGGENTAPIQSRTKQEASASRSQVIAAREVGVKSVVNIFQTDRCNELSRGGFIWFTDQVVLDDWLSPLDTEETKKIVSKIDFSKQGALLLDYGIAGSKGAGAHIVDDTLEIKGQEAFVRVKQFKAPSTKKGVQVVTHPCSLFVMPRIGFTKLVVLSDMDDELTSFENK